VRAHAYIYKCWDTLREPTALECRTLDMYSLSSYNHVHNTEDNLECAANEIFTCIMHIPSLLFQTPLMMDRLFILHSDHSIIQPAEVVNL
jgi:hypothetical protein